MTLLQRPKRETERIICEQFIESYFRKKVDIYQLPSDPPDFTFTSDDHEISVELTRLIMPQVKQKEAAQKRIVELAHAKFKSTSDLQLRVSVTFSRRGIEYSNKFMDSQADEISKNVFRICQETDDIDSIIYKNSKRPFNEYIDTLWVSSLNKFESWELINAFRVPHTDNEFIQKQINKKAEKLSSYEKKFDENWLLIASNLGYLSSAMRFDFIEPNLNRKNFDKIFLYEARSKEIWQV